jgi:hypothetical protein
MHKFGKLIFWTTKTFNYNIHFLREKGCWEEMHRLCLMCDLTDSLLQLCACNYDYSPVIYDPEYTFIPINFRRVPVLEFVQEVVDPRDRHPILCLK